MTHRRRILIAVLVLVAAGVLVGRRLIGGGGDDATLVASGTVEATEAHLGFPVAGLLARVAVREGDRVAAGQPLAWLDDAEIRARRDQAEAQATAARARLAELERGYRVEEIAQARSALDAVERQLQDAELAFTAPSSSWPAARSARRCTTARAWTGTSPGAGGTRRPSSSGC